MRVFLTWMAVALSAWLWVGEPGAAQQTDPVLPPAPVDEETYDRIVDDFIQYDIGKLRGAAGRIANQRFRSLAGSQPVPALVRGAVKASRIPASCPIA